MSLNYIAVHCSEDISSRLDTFLVYFFFSTASISSFVNGKFDVLLAINDFDRFISDFRKVSTLILSTSNAFLLGRQLLVFALENLFLMLISFSLPN